MEFAFVCSGDDGWLWRLEDLLEEGACVPACGVEGFLGGVLGVGWCGLAGLVFLGWHLFLEVECTPFFVPDWVGGIFLSGLGVRVLCGWVWSLGLRVGWPTCTVPGAEGSPGVLCWAARSAGHIGI